MLKSLGIAVAFSLILVACKKIPALTFEDAQKALVQTLSSQYQYGKRYRIVNFRRNGGFLDISHPEDIGLMNVSYELECLAEGDITGVMMALRRDGASSGTQPTYYRNEWARTSNGYRFAMVPIPPVTCSKGQSVSFEGMMTFRYDEGQWVFVAQSPDPRNPAPAPQNSTKKG